VLSLTTNNPIAILVDVRLATPVLLKWPLLNFTGLSFRTYARVMHLAVAKG
jgi:hypothetical protein